MMNKKVVDRILQELKDNRTNIVSVFEKLPYQKEAFEYYFAEQLRLGNLGSAQIAAANLGRKISEEQYVSMIQVLLARGDSQSFLEAGEVVAQLPENMRKVQHELIQKKNNEFFVKKFETKMMDMHHPDDMRDGLVIAEKIKEPGRSEAISRIIDKMMEQKIYAEAIAGVSLLVGQIRLDKILELIEKFDAIEEEGTHEQSGRIGTLVKLLVG